MQAYIDAILDEGGYLVNRDGTTFTGHPSGDASVFLRFRPRVKPENITDSTPDAEINPNSLMGAAELSVRQTYSKTGGPEATAAVSNAVNQGQIMAAIDQLHFNDNSQVKCVRKRAHEPWEIEFTDSSPARAFVSAMQEGR